MGEYKEYSCSNLSRFDWGALPAGRYQLKSGKIIRLEDDTSLDDAADRFKEALKDLVDGTS